MVSVSSVENVFDATMKSVVAGSSPIELGHQVGGVDVGDEPRGDAGVGVVAQRVVHHHRAQVRTADADVDDGRDAFTGRAGPLAAAQPVGEVAHLVEHLVHVLDDVLAVDGQLLAARQSQRGVQHRAVLRGVDVDAGEHRVAALLQSGGAGQVEQQLQRLPGDPVLAVVDVEVADRQCQLGAAGGVFGEELAQVFVADLVVMPLQGLPRGSGGDVGICCVSAVMFSTLVRAVTSKV